MTSIEYWQKLVAEHPEYADENAPCGLTVGELHTKMTMAHLVGCEYMKERQKESLGSFPDIFMDTIRGAIRGGGGKQ